MSLWQQPALAPTDSAQSSSLLRHGQHLDLLMNFLNLLNSRQAFPVDQVQQSSGPQSTTEFVIDETYVVPGVGTVISGLTLRGAIRQNDQLLLGPDSSGRFQSVAIRSIQRRRLPVTEVRAGQGAAFALKRVKRNQVRKGMVLSPWGRGALCRRCRRRRRSFQIPSSRRCKRPRSS